MCRRNRVFPLGELSYLFYHQELMEEDLKRELERNEAATKMAQAKEQEAQEAKRRFVISQYL